jgi:hypothetical protein
LLVLTIGLVWVARKCWSLTRIFYKIYNEIEEWWHRWPVEWDEWHYEREERAIEGGPERASEKIRKGVGNG